METFQFLVIATFLFYLLNVVMWGIEPRSWHVLSQYSTTELHPKPYNILLSKNDQKS